jgi:hypothetical protein
MASLGQLLKGVENAKAAGDEEAVVILTKMYNDKETELYGSTQGSDSDAEIGRAHV